MGGGVQTPKIFHGRGIDMFLKLHFSSEHTMACRIVYSTFWTTFKDIPQSFAPPCNIIIVITGAIC